MAICLPGMASKVNRAATSAMRPAPLVMTMKLMSDQDQEDHQADDVIAAHDKIAERLDDMPGVAVEQNEPRGSDVERQPVEGDKQQQGRKAGELGRLLDVKDRQQDEQRQGDADGQKRVEEERMDRQDHQQDGPEQPHDQQHVAVS